MENEKEMSFEELYSQSLKETKLEKTVTGKIISITEQGEIFVDLNYKADGIIPKKEYSDDENANPKNEFKIGDTITADVLKMNDGMGNVLLSYKRVKIREEKQELEKIVRGNKIIESKVDQVNEKGLITEVKGTRIFIPLSLSGIPKNEDIKSYIGKNIKFRITEYEPKQNKVIGSIRSVLDEEKKQKQEEFWANCEVGKEYIGTVASISTYGAFVDLGSVQGLLHASEISWERNINVNEILTQGQEIKVKVIEVDKENKRIKLSYIDKGENPWNNAQEKYNVGDVVKVKIVKFMPFGAFAQLQPGIEGLIHISQISEKKIAKPEEVLQQNQYVDAKIIKMNIEEKKIELSIKELENNDNEDNNNNNDSDNNSNSSNDNDSMKQEIID